MLTDKLVNGILEDDLKKQEEFYNKNSIKFALDHDEIFLDDIYNKIKDKPSNSSIKQFTGYVLCDTRICANYKIAIKLFREAIELNNPFAMCNLAEMYFYGRRVKKNHRKAFELYEMAIKLNCTTAMIEMAKHIHLYDTQKAFELCVMAIKLNNTHAIIQLYRMNNLYILDNLTDKYSKQIIELFYSIKDDVNVEYVIKKQLMEYIGHKVNILYILPDYFKLKDEIKYIPGIGEYFLKGQEEFNKLKDNQEFDKSKGKEEI